MSITTIPNAEGLEVVVIGIFNPAIFHPEWFLRQKIVSQDEADSSDTNLVSKDVAEIVIAGVKLMCMNDRFSIATSNISRAERMQDILLQLFTILSHIPVTACGINPNATYTVKNVEYWHKIGHSLVPKDLIWNDLLKSPGMQLVTIKSSRDGDFPGETFLFVEPAANSRYHPGIVVRANYHYSLPTSSLHADSSEILLSFLKKEWDQACGMARKCAETIFEKIRPDDA